MTSLSRRQLLHTMCALPFLGLGVAPKFLWAAEQTDKRLVVIILRGAMDGLAAVPPVGDPNFVRARGDLAQSAADALKINSYFALDKNLSYFNSLYQQRQALVFHAAALPYRQRSHFDAQNMLESGFAAPNNYESGWLNRTLQSPRLADSHPMGIALMSAVPLILRGPAQITSWMPNRLPEPNVDLVNRISMMYQGDPLLSPIIESATDTHGSEQDKEMKAAGNGKNNGQTPGVARAASRFLLDANGPRVAVIDMGGFDSHAGQLVPTGRLSKAIQELDNTIQAFAEGLAPVWNQTSILVMTEFGRTVAMNGTAGTDHGTGTVAFLAGGNVNGGQVLTDWPGLAPGQLYEGRDLKPTTDIHSVMKGVLAGHYRLDPDYINRTVFPQSASVAAFTNLYKS